MFERASPRNRSRLNLTAAASQGEPSWKVTPGSRSITSVFGSGNFQALAKPGLGVSVW